MLASSVTLCVPDLSQMVLETGEGELLGQEEQGVEKWDKRKCLSHCSYKRKHLIGRSLTVSEVNSIIFLGWEAWPCAGRQAL